MANSNLYVLSCFFCCFFRSSMSIASSLVGEDAKTKFLSKMGQLTTSGAMLANVFQRKKWSQNTDWPTAAANWRSPRCLWEHFISLEKASVQLKVEENQVYRLSNFKKRRFAKGCVGFKYAVQQDSVHFQGEQQCFVHWKLRSSPLLVSPLLNHDESVTEDEGFVNQRC